MADDIDIEEHDVLDNPAIRSIFPDISIIKKEISQYYEDGPNIKQEPDTFNEKPSLNQILLSHADERKNLHFKPQKPFPFKDIVDNCDSIHNLEETTVKGNKIILGSKPNSTVQETKKEGQITIIREVHKMPVESVVRIPKVVLQDLGAYIYNNNRYCKDCLTLFPNRSDCENHNRKVHSTKTRSKQINVKVQNRNKCNICGSCFSNSGNLSRHYRNIHRKKISFTPKYKSNRIAIRTHKSPRVASINISRGASNSSAHVELNKITRKNTNYHAKNLCFHCKKPFPDHKSLIEHIYQVLEPKRYPKEKTSKLSSIKDKHKTSTEKPKEKPANSTIYENQNTLVFKTFRDKLTFENQDSDEGEAQILHTIDPKRKAKVTVSTSHQPKGKQVNKNINVVNCCSKILRNKRKHEDQDLNASGPMETNKKKVNLLSVGSKSFNKKQEHEIGHKQLNGFTTVTLERNDKNLDLQESINLNAKQKTNNLNLDSPEPKTMKIKPTVENKQHLSMNSEDEIVEEALQSYESDEDKLKDRLVYECIYCSFVVPSVKAYHMHVVGKHKVDKILGANIVIFDEQCKFCPSKCKTDSARNNHVYSYHRDLLNKQFPNEPREKEKTNKKLKNTSFKMFESFVLESIIYKCNKCDIHFLSSCIAKDHEKHMEILINWKCSICCRIFKRRDKYLHLKQHNFSKTLNVCQFNESELSRLLYNCTKCAIHFTEERYLEHYSKCGDEATDSVYCKICDILVDKRRYINHDAYHKMGSNTTDFTVIVADIITMPKSKETEVVKKRKSRELINCLTFCPTCKCYLNYTHKTHIESRCSSITKYTCKLCGLVLTNKSTVTHRENHKKQKDLKLQDFKFFDLNGIQINPPIPDYPCCINCKVIFVSRNAVSSHICSEVEYLTCHICNNKLSENAYKLHMNFHNYSQLKAIKDTSRAVVVSELSKQENDTDKCNIITYPSSNTTTEYKHKDVITVDDKVGANDNSLNQIVYSCQSCKIAVITYDKVVEHCQNHFIPIPTISSTVKICSKCSLKFETDTYEIHQKQHLRYGLIQLLTFDPTYFTSDNNVWIQHIFSPVPQTVRKEIVSQSIYQHECRVKMEVTQKGPSYLTVYKCSKCGNFIDPDCLFAHVKNTCSKTVRKYPCSVCGLPFMANPFRSKHEKIHKRYDSARLKSYNIVLINCEAHNSHNTSIINAMRQFVLYQCRTCDGIVDKLQRNVHQCNVDDLQKCPICKLLLYKDDYERHISKHTDLAMFNTANMKVILFGNKDDSNLEKVLSPSFVGMVHDYKLYKCAKCEVCVNDEMSISRHLCTFDDSKWKCPKCSFYICARFSFKKHLKMHDVESEFKTENIKVVIFGTNEINSDETNAEMYPSHMENDSTKKCEQESNVGRKNANAEQVVVSLFKCACGLHYMDKLNANNHAKHCGPKIKVIRQMCSKCSLVFNPTELFSHIIAHHGDRNKIYKFEIIEISGGSVS